MYTLGLDTGVWLRVRILSRVDFLFTDISWKNNSGKWVNGGESLLKTYLTANREGLRLRIGLTWVTQQKS